MFVIIWLAGDQLELLFDGHRLDLREGNFLDVTRGLRFQYEVDLIPFLDHSDQRMESCHFKLR